MDAEKKTMLALAVAGAAALAGAAPGLAGGHAETGVMIALDEVEWQARPRSPVEVAVLAGDPATGAHVRLVKLPPGWTASDRMHTGAYRGVNPTGTWKHTFLDTGEARELPPGSFVFQTGGIMHGDACVGPEDCIPMLSQDVAADFILPE